VRGLDHAGDLVELVANSGDPKPIIAGHSMGGWVVANTAAHDHDLLGAILISAADMARADDRPRALRVARMAEQMEALAGVSDGAYQAGAQVLHAAHQVKHRVIGWV